MTSKIYPQLRAEKTTRNRDDLRVMMAGAIFCILMIMAQPFIFLLYDNWLAERPFVRAIVQVYHVEGRATPMIYYDADATQPVDGRWTGTIHSQEDGARIATRKGDGSYNSKVDVGKLWTWNAWFESDFEGGPPVVPSEPFKLCVSYVVEARDSGSQDESTEPFCSDYFDPANPTPVPEEFPQLGD